MKRKDHFVDAPMLIGAVGFLAVVVFMFNDTIDQTWGFTLGLFFAILLISSLVGMSPEIPGYVKNKKRKKL